METPEAYFCLKCGHQLVPQAIENRDRIACPNCGWVYYPQLKVGAGVWLEQDHRLLLLRRKTDPFRGMWYLPAGYVESDEDPASAAEREAFEETGLQVRVTGLKDALFFRDDPRGPGLLMIYTADIMAGDLKTTSETSDAAFFSADHIPNELCGAGHDRIIRRWIDSHAA